jgi:hypothetical protein
MRAAAATFVCFGNAGPRTLNIPVIECHFDVTWFWGRSSDRSGGVAATVPML